MTNSVYFDFSLTPVEAEGLYRTLNGVLSAMDEDDPNRAATRALRDRVLDFTRKHPCRYGAEAVQPLLTSEAIRLAVEKYPLDLASRLLWMSKQRDAATDENDRAVWQGAIDLTRNGVLS